MVNTQSSNKRIAKNTLMLYIRMVFVLIINLYVSRVVLKALGVEDYGLYSVVGSVVSFLGFLNTSMASAAQRFLSFAQGRGDENQLNRIFNSVFSVQVILAVFVLIVFETIGIVYINNFLNVDPAKIGDAHIVFQFSIAAFLVTVLTVPYNASIIANERMDVFALYGIIEVLLKLAIALSLSLFESNTLIYYAALTFGCGFFIQYLNRWFCRKHFTECKLRRNTIDRKTIKEILSYAGWNLFGTFSGVAANQGVNMILNSFFGVVVNAARGISFQVSASLAHLYTNFQQALNPQIVKSYAANDLSRFYSLITQGTRLAFFLLFVCALPIMYNMEGILKLWLGDVPEYTTFFCILVIINSLFGTVSQSLLRGAMATGKIRKYQIVVSTITLLNLPLSYIALRIYPDPYLTVYIMIVLSFAAFVARLVMLHQMAGLSIFYFVRGAIVPIIIAATLSVVLASGFDMLLPATGGIGRMFLRITAMLMLCCIAAVIFGMRREERLMVISFIRNRIKR